MPAVALPLQTLDEAEDVLSQIYDDVKIAGDTGSRLKSSADD